MRIASLSFTDRANTAYLYVYNDGFEEEKILRIMAFNRDYMSHSDIVSEKIPPKEFSVIKITSSDFSRFIGHFTSIKVEGEKSLDEVGIRVFPTFFPVGSYGGNQILSDKDNTMEALELGFDTLVAGVSKIEEAKKYGFRVIAYVPYKDNRLDIESFNKFAKDEGVLAWYVIDEPDIQIEKGRYSLDWLTHTVREIYRRDKMHPTYIVLCKPFIFEKYAGFPDVLAVDPYPVCILPLTYVSFEVDRGIETARPKPVWLIPQAFRHGRPKPNGNWGWKRFPKPDEERLMVYLGLSHGAKGIIYYTYYSVIDNVRDPVEGMVSRHPDAVALKRGIAHLSGELHALGEVLRFGYHVTGPSAKRSYSSNGSIEINEIFCRDDTLLIMLVNHDYISAVDGFNISEKRDVEFTIVLPKWFDFEDSFIVDEKGLEDIKVSRKNNRIVFKLGSIRIAKTVVLTSDRQLFKMMDEKYRVWRRI